LEFEENVGRWPQTSTKKMFGCPSYQANGKLFAFLVTNGIVITQLVEPDREALSRRHRTSAFKARRKTVQNWVRLSAENTRDLERIMPFVRKNYEAARRKA